MTVYVILSCPKNKPPALKAVFTDEAKAKALCDSGAIPGWIIVQCEANVWPPLNEKMNNLVDIMFSSDNKQIIHVEEYSDDSKKKLPVVNKANHTVTLSTSTKAYQDFKYKQEYGSLLKAAERAFPVN